MNWVCDLMLNVMGVCGKNRRMGMVEKFGINCEIVVCGKFLNWFFMNIDQMMHYDTCGNLFVQKTWKENHKNIFLDFLLWVHISQLNYHYLYFAAIDAATRGNRFIHSCIRYDLTSRLTYNRISETIVNFELLVCLYTANY